MGKASLGRGACTEAWRRARKEPDTLTALFSASTLGEIWFMRDHLSLEAGPDSFSVYELFPEDVHAFVDESTPESLGRTKGSGRRCRSRGIWIGEPSAVWVIIAFCSPKEWCRRTWFENGSYHGPDDNHPPKPASLRQQDEDDVVGDGVRHGGL